MRSVLLVANPSARSGKAEPLIKRTLKAMRDRGWAAEFLSTEPDGRTVGLVREALEKGGCEVLAYMGGDGTFAEVTKGLMAAGIPVPMGLLPAGTANNLGKTFGISADPDALHENLDIIQAGHVQEIDVGRVQRMRGEQVLQEDYFFDSVGWGFQPAVLAKRNRHRRRVGQIPVLRDVYRDQAVYAGAAVKSYLESFVEPTKFTAEVTADGAKHVFTGLTDLIINATPVYGGEWILERLAEPDDGLFEVVPFKGRRELFSKAIRDLEALPIWQEHLDELGITHTPGFQASEMTVELIRPSRRDVEAQIDGEEFGAGHSYRVSCAPRLLPLITREDWIPPWQRPS